MYMYMLNIKLQGIAIFSIDAAIDLTFVEYDIMSVLLLGGGRVQSGKYPLIAKTVQSQESHN